MNVTLRSSAVVAQVAVNHLVGGSNPSSGAMHHMVHGGPFKIFLDKSIFFEYTIAQLKNFRE